MDTITTTLGVLIGAEPYLHRVSALPLKSKEQPDGLTPAVKRQIVKLAQAVAAETKVWQDQRAEIFAALGIETGRDIRELKAGVWADYLERIKPVDALEVTLNVAPLKYAEIPLALAADVIGLGPLCVMDEAE